MFRRPRLAAIAAGAALALTLATAAAATASPADVRVDPRPVSVVGRGAVGIDAQFWNGTTVNSYMPGLVRAAGLQLLDWDAGMPLDMYDWQTNTLRPDPEPEVRFYPYSLLQPRFNFDQFAQLAQQGGVPDMMVHVNYGTGTPEEAAAWVRYANVQHGYGVKYWEIGESMHFNGWSPTQENIEPDGHADKSPEAYASNVLEFIRAMKAVDPTIHVGVGLSSRNWDPELMDWNTRVLRIVGTKIDFVDLFVFGSGWPQLTDEQLLARPRGNAALIGEFRDLVDQYQGENHHVDIVIGEATSVANATGQQVSTVSALFLADHYMTLLKGGADQVHWYNLAGQIQGNLAQGYGDMGVISSGFCANDSLFAEPSDYCQPPAGTPFPAYYGLKLLQRLTRPGAVLLDGSSTDDKVVVHASRRPDGRLAVLLINEDPSAARSVRLDVPGSGRRYASISRYGTTSSDVERTRTRLDLSQPLELAPYSLTAVVLGRAY